MNRRPSVTQADAAEKQSPGHTAAKQPRDDDSSMSSSQATQGQVPWRTVTIVLATTIPSVIVMIIAAVLWRRSRKRKSRLFNRGITPIDDQEIESWKRGQGTCYDDEDEEKQRAVAAAVPPRRQRSRPRGQHVDSRARSSVVSVQKPPSVIVYQNARPSEELPSPPLPAHGKRSADTAPQTPILARAPNSRPGLTDETVQGADAFIRTCLVKQSSFRLAKAPAAFSPRSPPRHGRSKSTRATMTGTTGGQELWYGRQMDQQQQPPLPLPPRRSADGILPPSPSHHAYGGGFSSRSTPTRSSFEDEYSMGGLSPRPLIHKSEIGRAIG